jgi:hypothetical protein
MDCVPSAGRRFPGGGTRLARERIAHSEKQQIGKRKQERRSEGRT